MEKMKKDEQQESSAATSPDTLDRQLQLHYGPQIRQHRLTFLINKHKELLNNPTRFPTEAVELGPLLKALNWCLPLPRSLVALDPFVGLGNVPAFFSSIGQL
jgi:hypothetical protein